MEIGFSLGSNTGDRRQHMSKAKEALLAFDDTTFVGQSPLYETEPVDVRPEYKDLYFLNSVLIVESTLPVEAWLERIASIEESFGRIRTGDRNAPRSVDIDILYAGDQCIDSGGLVVPHPRWMQRRFVVEPLAAVRPNLCLPGCDAPVREILERMDSSEGISVDTEDW